VVPLVGRDGYRGCRVRPAAGRAREQNLKEVGRMNLRTLSSALVLALLLPATPCTASYFCPLECVVIEPTEGGMDVRHVQAEYNCCCWVDFNVVREGHAIDIYEMECFEVGPCYCMCCFELEVSIGGLEPGPYTVTVWKDGVFFGTWEVVVEGTSPERLETSYVPCVETSTPEPPAFGTWGTIKALYRPR
jgi:hypothetical protein